MRTLVQPANSARAGVAKTASPARETLSLLASFAALEAVGDRALAGLRAVAAPVLL